MDWQEIDIEGFGRAKRRAVPQGWLVAALEGPRPGHISVVRDPDHTWDGALFPLR
ncbi:MAG: hypothetical protein H6697_02565 [Myxococcales bacterium]|nr:hypothetical protein [Myxococcales bacterium]